MTEVEKVDLGASRPSSGWLEKIHVVLDSDVVDRLVKARFEEFLELDSLSPRQVAWVEREHASVVQHAADLVRIEELLVDPGSTERERDAFADMHAAKRVLSGSQRSWLDSVCERLGHGAAENLWSSGKVPVGAAPPGGRAVMPWEKPGYEKPTKPPGRK